MTTADYALIVSICSGVVAACSLGWNVWSKFIYPKPRLRIVFCAITIIDHVTAPEDRPRYLAVNITNHGPIETTVHSFSVKFSRGRFKKPQFAYITPIHDILRPEIGIGIFGGGLPKKLAVGETFSLYFPFIADSFARDPLSRAGVSDVFGRFHKISRSDIAKVKAELTKEFGDAPLPGMADRPS
ncbi:hypothetical protein [Brevundimonas sp.]|uniref:hypothetical protein n=1 Tax=Brevundimonas sp. TaxID=1871086 RepID=UPI0028ACECAD|nr:hypothetical protein [Brevundimonas sp.]